MLQNSILLLLLIPVCFGAVLFAKKFFGKAGLFAWIAIASAASNIAAASVGPMCGFDGVTLANVPFCTVFLACQILTACYGVEEGKKGVYIGLFSSISFLIIMTTCSYLIPSEYDTVTGSIANLFNLNSFGVCNTIASVIMFFIANLMDVYVFEKLNKKLPQKYIWVSSILACNICNCLENFAFVLLGLYLFPLIFNAGAYPINDCLVIALTTCVFEIVLGFLNGPVITWAKKLHMKNDVDEIL